MSIEYVREHNIKYSDPLHEVKQYLIKMNLIRHYRHVDYLAAICDFATDLDILNVHLITAVKYNNLVIVKMLINYGADITDNNNYVVNLASYNRHLELIKYFHENGANALRGFDLMRWANINGLFGICEYLYHNSTNFTIDSINLASRNGHLDIVRYLCDNSE